MSTGNVVVSQDAPAKNNLWIQPKGTARFWNGSFWKTISGSGGSSGPTNLSDLEDIGLSSLTNGQILKYNSTTQKWENTNVGDLSNYYTKAEANTNFLSKNFFKKLFQAHYGSSDVDPENPTTDSSIVVDSIEAMFGFWTEQYISALGQNGSSSGGGGGLDIEMLWQCLRSDDGGLLDETPKIYATLLGNNLSENKFLKYIGNNYATWTSLSISDIDSLQNTLSGKQDKLPTSGNIVGNYYINISGNAATATSAVTATTANKLSTISKTAWGQTFWTSGGVPESISGDMSNVGNIISSGNKTKNIGESNHIWNTLYVDKIQIGNAIISFDNRSGYNMIKVDAVEGTTFNGLYTTGALSALGANPISGGGGGSGSGLDITTLWNELRYSNYLSTSWSEGDDKIIERNFLPLNGISALSSPNTRTFYAPTSAGTNGYILKSNGSGAPSWLNILPVANGGTGNTTGTANYSYYSKIVASNEIRFDVNTKPPTNSTLFIGYKWSDATSDARIKRYAFCNGNGSYSEVQASTFYGDLSGNAATATKLGTSNIGNSITPFYLNSGVATACDIYRYHYDNTSDYASYAWHKVAYGVAVAQSDRVVTFLVTKGNTATINGILKCRVRWDANSAFNSSNTKLNWVVNNGIDVNNFVFVWKSPNIELWCKITEQYGGYQFAVLDSGNRADNGILTWTLCDSVSGHGSASYTSGDTVITSTNATLTNNISGTVNSYSISSTVNSGIANRLAYYTSSGIDDASTTYVSNTKLAINSTSEPSYNLYVYGTADITTSALINNITIGANTISSGSTLYLDSAASTSLIFRKGTTEMGRWNSNSNLIVGTPSNPNNITNKLYVNGDSYLNGTTYNNGNLLLSPGSTGIYLNGTGISWHNASNTYVAKQMTFDGTNVGIGTDSPAYKLDVKSDSYSVLRLFRNHATNGAGIRFENNSGCLGNFGYDGSGYYVWTDSSGNNKMIFKPDGTLGVNTTSPSSQCKLHVDGNIYATGGVTALQAVSSDKRLKKNIKKFNAKDIIDKLNPVSFEWNSKAKKLSDFKDGTNYGLIAQDSDGIIDNLVFDLPDGKGYKGVRYEKLIPILLQAIKEQNEKIENLEYEINVLKGVYK